MRGPFYLLNFSISRPHFNVSNNTIILFYNRSYSLDFEFLQIFYFLNIVCFILFLVFHLIFLSQYTFFSKMVFCCSSCNKNQNLPIISSSSSFLFPDDTLLLLYFCSYSQDMNFLLYILFIHH